MNGTKGLIWIICLSLGIMLTAVIGSSINTIPTKQQAVQAAWGQVENVYQRRSDLIPNLVEVVKGYADHEKSTLIGVIEARAKATQVRVDARSLPGTTTPAQFLAAQDSLGQALGRLLVSMERYPDLKADQRFASLQAQLEGTENRIAVERRNYVLQVQDYNTYVTTLPGMLWAKLIFNASPIEQFKAEAGAEKAPKVKF